MENIRTMPMNLFHNTLPDEKKKAASPFSTFMSEVSRVRKRIQSHTIHYHQLCSI